MNSRECWAKTDPFQSVYTHAVISGIVAKVVLSDYFPEGNRTLLEYALGLKPDELSSFIAYLVSLHDIGKLEFSFQAQNIATRELLSKDQRMNDLFVPGVRHEKTGQDSLRAIWRELGEDRRSGSLFSKIVGAHHQGKAGLGNYKPFSPWTDVQKSMEAEMRRIFLVGQPQALPVILKDLQGPASALLLGIMILSDWISSGELFADAEQWIDQENAKEKIVCITRSFISNSGLKTSQIVWPDSFSGLWPSIPKDGIRPLQVETENTFVHEKGNRPLLFLVEAPMGEGKTEAGVFAALQMSKCWHKNGLYFALPTAATANQMVGRIRGLMDMHKASAPVRLLHSMAWLDHSNADAINSQDDSSVAASWLAPIKRGLLGQFAVGTIDQAMFAATNVKYGVLRLLGLSGKVLIIDEIHSYDAYMGEIIIRLLEWCKSLEIPVVMLSATLPRALKEKLLKPYTSQSMSADYPLLTSIDQNGVVTERIVPQTNRAVEYSLRFSTILNDCAKIADAAVKEVESGGCLCLLMNTVREAQEVYSAVKTRYDGDLLLFHAQFPAGQRAKIEAECIRRYGKDKSKRPKRSILIATQVVEQSLDVDFDAMITAVAPADLLLQRMGRVFRHSETSRPPSHSAASVTILCPPNGNGFGASSYVYPECLLKSAIRVMGEYEHVRVPEDIAPIVHRAYSPDLAPQEEAKQWMNKLLRDDVEAGASQRYLLNSPDKLFSPLDSLVAFGDETESFSLSAKTRLGEPTVTVSLLPPQKMKELAPYLKKKNDRVFALVRDHKLAETVMKHSVSVNLRRLGDSESGFSYIVGDSLIKGVWIFPAQDGRCRLENGKTLCYDPELGLLIKEGEL